MGVMLGVSQPAGTALRAYQAYAYTERSAKISATTLNVRSGPGTSNASVARLSKNAALQSLVRQRGATENYGIRSALQAQAVRRRQDMCWESM